MSFAALMIMLGAIADMIFSGAELVSEKIMELQKLGDEF